MLPRALPIATLFLASLCLAMPGTGLAQGNSANAGNGKPKAPKNDKPATPATQQPASPAPTPSPTTSPTPSPTPAPTSPAPGTVSSSVPPVTTPLAAAPDLTLPPDVFATVTTFRQFGSWLDDASALSPGEGQTSIGLGHWRMQGMTQTNLPMVGMSVGLSDRWQVGASLPFYRLSYDGAVAKGVDDIYASAKFVVVDPTLTLSEVGLSVSPVVEILSAGSPSGRIHFAIPVNLEVRRLPFRVYGSAGYFTRGSVFTGGAVEWTSPTRLTVTGAFTQSYSMKADASLDAMGIGARRADLTGSVSYPFGRVAAGWVSAGRSLSPIEEGGTIFSLAGGVAFRFTASRPRP